MKPESRPRLRVIPGGAYRGETYCRRPALKASRSGWLPALAFFFEGIGGASQMLATVADLFGWGRDRGLVRAGRYLALASSMAAPAALAGSLKTPRLWYNVLRIYRKTSAMSPAGWFLASFGLLSGLAAVGQLLDDVGLRRVGRGLARAAGVPAAAAGGLVSLYLGGELEETAAPARSSARPSLSPLYAATAASDAAAALLLAAAAKRAPEGTRRRLAWFAAVADAARMALGTKRAASWRRRPGGPLFRQRKRRSLFRDGVLAVGAAVPLAVRAVHAARRRPRALSVAASAASLAGGFLLSAATLLAGRPSGTRPRDYFASAQRAGAAPARPEGKRAAGRTQRRGLWAWGVAAAGVGLLTAATGKKTRRV
ncbi:MAG: polysulfide reductase NrfD [Deltaproteobacteria bacterium]|nr:polysulfide reductase NrfD [Deltaproteobacteria bacterium]